VLRLTGRRLVALTLFASACTHEVAPTAPSTTPGPAPETIPFFVPPVPAPPNASLSIERLSILVGVGAGVPGFWYEPRFELRETGGTSGATLQNIFVRHPDGGGDNTGPGCWRDVIRVPPGGMLDTFLTDEGSAWLGYCAPVSGGSTETPQLAVVVTFTDDAGRSGRVEATARGSR